MQKSERQRYGRERDAGHSKKKRGRDLETWRIEPYQGLQSGLRHDGQPMARNGAMESKPRQEVPSCVWEEINMDREIVVASGYDQNLTRF